MQRRRKGTAAWRLVVLLAFAVGSGSLHLAPGDARAENWPQWRGPAGTGTSADARVPISWSPQRGILWATALPPWGTSTPVVWGDAVFVTAHSEQNQLLLIRLNKSDGKVQWVRQVGQGVAPREAASRSTQKFHELHNLASPSPVTNGRQVVVHFGNGLLAAYDYSGDQLWQRNLQDDYGRYSIWWGRANSPVLYEGSVISVCMQDSLADKRTEPVSSYLVAHDLRDGHVRWKVERMTGARAEQGDAYTTPLLIRHNDRPELIVMGANQLDSYDPANGKRRWWMPGLVGGRTVTSPTSGQEMVFATEGMRGSLVAVRLGHSGKLTRRDIVWKADQGTPDTCCPVVWDSWLFVISDDGIARCWNALSGHLQWKQRLPGGYKASPIVIDGRVYFLNTEGRCTVISASSRFDKLTDNQIDDQFIASPAVSDGRLLLRGRKGLYCIAHPRPLGEASP